MKNNSPIDAVITWVDGDDPRHRSKREKYGNVKMLTTDDVAGSTRYTSVGEILYCVASLNRYAPWLNKIYIVTDEQNPHVDAFLDKYFPDGHIPVEIVDHKTIFRGYEEYLPTFNSISIESMTWRIPGLSDRFIEFNDDLILAAPTTPEDFFTPAGLVCYGKPYSMLWARFSRLFTYRKDGTKKITFKQTMCNAATQLGRHFSMIKIYHTPKALLRSFYEEFFTAHPDILRNNICHRFRNVTQYNPQELQYLTLYREGRCELRRANDNLLYMKPNNNKEYVDEKLDMFVRNSHHKFACINSLDQATEQERVKIIEWIERRIGLKS